MRRSHGKRSAARRRIGSRNRWFSSGASVVLREPAGAESTTPTLAPLQAGARSPPFTVGLRTKKRRFRPATTTADETQDASLVASRFGAISRESLGDCGGGNRTFASGILSRWLTAVVPCGMADGASACCGGRRTICCHSSCRAIAIGQSGTIPDAKVRIPPPQPASRVSVSHVRLATFPRVNLTHPPQQTSTSPVFTRSPCRRGRAARAG